MLLSDYDKKPTNPSLKCNSLSSTTKSINIVLTPSEAIELARNVLQKAQLLLDEGITDGGVHVWCADNSAERLSCGLNKLRKGERRRNTTSR